jgi:hypothetical protein
MILSFSTGKLLKPTLQSKNKIIVSIWIKKRLIDFPPDKISIIQKAKMKMVLHIQINLLLPIQKVVKTNLLLFKNSNIFNI